MIKSPKRILIVEDDPALAELLVEVLSDQNFTCFSLPYAEEILPVVYDFKPDVVLLDYLLPIANGEELCARIKQNKLTCSIPVIIYSAFPDTLLPVNEFQCDRFLSKPFDLYYLLQLIEKLASGYRNGPTKGKTGVFHF
jgi:DNA-binding response OmpR family regulator